VNGKTEARGPGSLIYEPFGLVHQWGNPGDEPLTFLAFNINPEGVVAVLPRTRRAVRAVTQRRFLPSKGFSTGGSNCERLSRPVTGLHGGMDIARRLGIGRASVYRVLAA